MINRGIRWIALVSIFLFFACSSFGKGEPPLAEGIRVTKYPDNYTAFKFVDSRGVVVITDPYMMDEAVDADIVTESHSHSDHTDSSRIAGDYLIIDAPGEYAVKGIKVRGVEGDHNRVREGSRYEEIVHGSKNTIFVFDLGGIRIAQFGAQGAPLSEEQYRSIGQVDVLILQVFRDPDRQKLSIEDGVEIAGRLKPKVIIPAHGDPHCYSELAKALGARLVVEGSGRAAFTAKGIAEAAPTLLVLDRP